MNRESYEIRNIPDLTLTFDNGEVFFFDTIKISDVRYSKNQIKIQFEDALLLEGIEEAIAEHSLITVKREQCLRKASNGEDVWITTNFPNGNWDISCNYKSNCTGEPESVHYILTLNKN